MKTSPFIFASAVVLACALPLHAEVREFHSAKGSAIKAELVKVRGANVVIRDESGKENSVPLKGFSRDDVTYICRWIAAEPTALDYRFDAKETEKAADKIPGTGGSRARTGYSAYGTADESLRGYEISVSNRCANPVEGVRACYRIFLLDCVEVSAGDYAQVMAKRKLLFKSGNVELPTLSYNGSFKFSTRYHTLQKMKAANNWDGVSERDRLRGVWVKFYRHGVEVSEWKSPTCPKCEWPESATEKSALDADKEKQKPLLAALTAPLTEPVKPAPKPTPAPKSAPPPSNDKDDLAEELKIFDLGDVTDEKPVKGK